MFLKLIRALDGILVGIASLFVLAVLPAFVGSGSTTAHLLFILPVLWIAWCCCRLPLQFHQIDGWQKAIVNLRLSTLACAWLTPFMIWWISSPDHLYLYLNALLAAGAAAAVVFHLNVVMLKISRFAGNGGLEMEANMARVFTLYMALILIFGMLVGSLILAWFRDSSLGIGAFVIIFDLIPRPVLYVPLMPIVLTATLLARVRQPLEEMFHAVTQDRL